MIKRLLRLGPADRAHSYETVLGALLFGTAILFVLLLLPLLFSFFVAGNLYVLVRIFICLTILAFTGSLLFIWNHFKLYKTAATLLVLFYGVVSILAMGAWGISTPFPLLLGGFVVVLAGVLLGARHTLWAASYLSLAMLVLQILMDKGMITPTPQVLYPSRYGDVVGFSVVFGIIALVSWISSRQMERALTHALQAEKDLLKEKSLLAERLEERTRTLQAAQLQEMQQLYRFAELGQLSTAMLHDLSNHLTVLTLDIEDLHQSRHSSAIRRAKHTIFYLDKIVDQVRTRLQEENRLQKVHAYVGAKEVAQQLRPRAQQQEVTIEVKADQLAKRSIILGDPVRLNQVLAILVTNAIDAYRDFTTSDNQDRRVVIQLVVLTKQLGIHVTDWGRGISKKEQTKLFKPFYSTKEDGMGIGLFIAKQMVETHLKGSVSISPSLKSTEFIIKIPLHTKDVS